MKKIINKPWGREEWLELNDKYCYKRIYVNKGTRTSFQYHNKKVETNYIIDGDAEIWLENDQGEIEKKFMSAGDFFTVNPPRKHRVIALTDIILQEVSTPEVDDVIRIEDDAKRESGKIESEHLNPAFCILTAGCGTRMGEFSSTNKSLLPLKNEAVISHIIKKIPINYDIVVVLGHKGNIVKEYCEAAHPERNFNFIFVDKYEGEGSGPGYSILQAKHLLQRPFIWTTSDTLVEEEYPDVSEDWIGIHPTSIPEIYSTVKIKDNLAIGFMNKDKNGFNNAFIGLAGVKSFKKFWEDIENSKNTKELEIVSAYYDLSENNSIPFKKFTWNDIGTIDNYIRLKSKFENHNSLSLEKNNGEFVYKVNDKCIKISNSKDSVKGRIKRSENLKSLIPPLTFKGENVYSYRWINGKTLYDIDDVETWKRFLSFLLNRMWEKEDCELTDTCNNFYKVKTLDRLEQFLSNRSLDYKSSHLVNNKQTDDIQSLLNRIDWSILTEKYIPTKVFHGDLQFDNVVLDNNENFYLIDWRQDFSGESIGDAYYDIAKLYGGILISYSYMKDSKNYSLSKDDNKVKFNFKTNDRLEKFESIFLDWINQNNFDAKKIKLLTSLIYLNMSPLHEKDFGDILFFKSKLMIQEFLDEDR